MIPFPPKFLPPGIGTPATVDSETHAWTIRGPMPRSLLDHTSGKDETDDAIAHWQEWRVRATGQLVRRDVHVDAKRGIQIGVDQATFPR